MVNRVTTRLSNRGFSVVALSGELTQSERTNALQAMRDGRARVCVATDVAARGIDLPNLELVVHAELPSNHETLLHRSGRTGRAGRKGTSALIVTAKVRSKAMRILKGARLDAEWIDAPSADAIRAQDELRMLDDPMWTDPVTEAEAAMVAKLAEQFEPAQLAAAILRMHAQRHSAPEHLSAVTGDTRPKARAPFGPSVWFSLTGGRNQGVEVRRLLPIICNAGNITREDIGAIRILGDLSYVEILATSADGFASALGTDMKIEGGAVVTRLQSVPAAASQPKPRFAPKSSGKPAVQSPKKDDDTRPKHGLTRRVWDKAATKPARAASPSPEPKSKPSAPVERNDATPPRHKKPKPKSGERSRAGKASTALEKAFGDSSVSTRKKPRHKSGSKTSLQGRAPKVGKPNSKKNKARRAAAAAAGGTQPPRRKS